MDTTTQLCLKSMRLGLCKPNPDTRRRLADFWRTAAKSHPEIQGWCIDQACIADREAETLERDDRIEQPQKFRPTQHQGDRAIPDMTQPQPQEADGVYL